MANKHNKEEWIDEVLASTRGMQRAEASNDLYEHVKGRLTRPPATKTIFPAQQWTAAAILLLAVNAGSVVYFLKQGHKGTEVSQGTIEIQSVTTYNY